MEFTSRKFGVEIEFLSDGVSLQSVSSAINAAGITCNIEHYNHHTPISWKLTTDASCGYELVSPILQGEDGLSQIEKVCSALKSAGAKVNKSCGLHVHVDARDLKNAEIARVIFNYAKNERVFDSLQPESRRNNINTYCGSVTKILSRLDTQSAKESFTRNPFKLYNSVLCTRYVKVNLEAYTRHSTVEFRQHSGTIESSKITNWVVLLLGFVEKSRNSNLSGASKKQTLDSFRIWLNLWHTGTDSRADALCSYITKRFKELNPTKSVLDTL